MKDIRILFLGVGPVMPATSPVYKSKFAWLSKVFAGDIVVPVTARRHLQIRQIGKFCLHSFIPLPKIGPFSKILSFCTVVIKALKVFYFVDKFDVVVSSDPLISGLAALLIRAVTGTKAIVEVNGDFGDAFMYDTIDAITFQTKLKIKISSVLIPFVLARSDMVKLLYKGQIQFLERTLGRKLSVRAVSFHDFADLRRFFEAEAGDEKYILLLGYPWYLKGVDLLIKAFKKIAPEFPDYRLKVVGWCPEGKEYFEKLARGNERIDLMDPVYHDEVVRLMSKCSVYVLASRTEAMGRVLLEAMACKKPIIAANVGGVPAIIKDRYNGLLFQKEDVGGLADRLREVLKDKRLARELSMNGYTYVRKNLSERVFVDKYKKMVEEAIACP